MATGGDPRELGHLLRSRRERLTRQRSACRRAVDAAPPGSGARKWPSWPTCRRRTTRSRAGPSFGLVQILDALAAALRMSEAEHCYLLVLARGQELLEINDAAATSSVRQETVDQRAVDLVQRLEPFPP